MVRDVVSLLERSIERYGLMETGIMVNKILLLLKEHDPTLHDVFLVCWWVILHF